MSHWMLVVSHDPACPPRSAIEVPLFSDFDADYEVRRGSDDDWQEIELRFASCDDGGEEGDFATIYRKVEPALVAEEVASFVENLEDVEPARAAAWIVAWLRAARAVYRFTLHDRDRDEAMAALRAVLVSIQRTTGGLLYAEGEGWSNLAGHLVTWEFDRDDGHAGPWWCAVLDEDGQWREFCLELGDARHRQAFRAGQPPP